MKIYERQSVIFNQTDKDNKKNISGKSDFQSIMDQMTSISVTRENNAAADIQMPFVNSTGIIIKESPAAVKEEAMNNLKDTLDLVEFYAEKLADSSLSSDSLSPLVAELEERMDILKEMGSNAQIDDRLKTILTDAATNMGVEIERFKRGDYL